MSSAQVVVNSLLTEYDINGQGPIIVLLHGWADNRRSFAPLAKRLADQYTVISLDLPGFGGSEMPRQVWGLDDYAAFVAAFLSKIQAGPVLALIGHSNGATVAIRGLATGQITAQKAVLLAAAGIRTTQQSRKQVLKIVAKTGKILTFWLPTHYRQKLRHKLYSSAGSDMLLKPQLQETFKRTVGQDVQADAAQLQLPVLLIYGQEDPDTPPLYGQLYHNLIANSTLEVIGQAGHFVHHDQTAKVLAAIKEFLR